MALFDRTGFADDATQRIGRQLASLSREASHVTESLRRLTANTGRDAGHYAHDLADQALHQGTAVARVVGKQAWRAGRAVSRDPAPAIAAVVGVACLLTLVLGSGKRSRR